MQSIIDTFTRKIRQEAPAFLRFFEALNPQHKQYIVSTLNSYTNENEPLFKKLLFTIASNDELKEHFQKITDENNKQTTYLLNRFRTTQDNIPMTLSAEQPASTKNIIPKRLLM